MVEIHDRALLLLTDHGFTQVRLMLQNEFGLTRADAMYFCTDALEELNKGN